MEDERQRDEFSESALGKFYVFNLAIFSQLRSSKGESVKFTVRAIITKFDTSYTAHRTI